MNKKKSHARLKVLVRDTGFGRVGQIIEQLPKLLLLVVQKLSRVDKGEDRHRSRETFSVAFDGDNFA